MATKKNGKQLVQPMKEDPNALRIQQQPTETVADALAHTSLRPTVQAATTLMEYNKNLLGELSINTLVADLEKQCELASKGDLTRAEALLTAQAHTLDALFNNLARRAALNMGEYMNAAETPLHALGVSGACVIRGRRAGRSKKIAESIGDRSDRRRPRHVPPRVWSFGRSSGGRLCSDGRGA